jgi:hypothetical protein
MIHYVYAGHFARERGFIAFQKHADGSVRPVVQRALSMEAVQKHFGQYGLTSSEIPEDWGLWLDDGFIVCDRFTHRREAIELVRGLAAETGCDIADLSSLSFMTPKELRFAPDAVIPCSSENADVPA